MRAVLPLLASLCLFAGCRGPRSSPAGSVKSFFSALESQDWSSMADIASDASFKRVGTRERAIATFQRDYDGWDNIDITIKEELIDVDGKSATVIFGCVSTQIINYKEQKFDCSDTWMLVKQDDDKWHLHLPGTTRVRPMQ